MLRLLSASLFLVTVTAHAQDVDSPAHHMMGHHGAIPAQTVAAPTEAGQSAFAAIQEIVSILEADPQTDWTKVDIEALRQHLIDMHNVTVEANVSAEPLPAGMHFTVTGTGPVVESIQRMVSAHAATMNGVDGWSFSAANVNDGAVLSVGVPPPDMQKVQSLGFIGVMTHGMHHQEHHLMIARGDHPHP
jgi:hypothetical protein